MPPPPGLDSSTRTLSTPSPGLILPSKSSSLSSPALSSNGHETNSSSSSSAAPETVAVVHPQPGGHARPRPSKVHHHPPIDVLPDHTLLQILAHLPTNQLCRCARVCRRWYNLAWDPRLWATIRLTGELLHADRAVRVLTHRLCQDTPNVCLTLETVMANGCKRLTDRALYALAQCCPELRRLEVAGCYNISNDAVFEVVSRCPNLEHLNLSGKPGASSHPLVPSPSFPGRAAKAVSVAGRRLCQPQGRRKAPFRRGRGFPRTGLLLSLRVTSASLAPGRTPSAPGGASLKEKKKRFI